jgi:hypothetical protein
MDRCVGTRVNGIGVRKQAVVMAYGTGLVTPGGEYDQRGHQGDGSWRYSPG